MLKMGSNIKIDHNHFMRLALDSAIHAKDVAEVPVGAIIVRRDTKEIIVQSHNMVECSRNPLFHAEILAINQACKLLGEKYLYEYDLYVTLEPCSMCAAAISLARIGRLFYGASDPKFGGVEHGVRFFTSGNCHHRPEIYPGINQQESADILIDFFKNLRE